MKLLSILHRLSARERTLFAAVLIMMSIVLGYGIFIGPPATQVKKLRRSVADEEQRLTMRYEQMEQADQLKRAQANLKQTFGLVHERMFSPTELHPLLKQLALDVKQSDCELLSILPSTSSTTSRPGTVLSVESIEIRLRGSYRALTEAVRRIEQRPQFVSIDDILLEVTSQAHQLQAVITLHVYSFNALGTEAKRSEG